MTPHIGTKMVLLSPMTRADYNLYRGWQLPPNEIGADEGYLVEYTDGGAGNDERHAGYISWSPRAQAEAAYRPCDALTFDHAVYAIRRGLRARRAAWMIDGGPMWIALDHDAAGKPFVTKLATNRVMTPQWQPSQADMLAEDWQII